MSSQTKAVQTIINHIETAVQTAYNPHIMKENIMNEAQRLVNEGGYVLDVALTIACRMYPATYCCGASAYAK